MTENKITLGKDNIIYVDIARANKAEDIMKLLDKLIALIKAFKGKVKVLLKIKTSSVITSSVFRKEVGIKFKRLHIDRAAMCGGNIMTRTIASFIIATFKLENIKIFIDKKEALSWLQEI